MWNKNVYYNYDHVQGNNFSTIKELICTKNNYVLGESVGQWSNSTIIVEIGTVKNTLLIKYDTGLIHFYTLS